MNVMFNSVTWPAKSVRVFVKQEDNEGFNLAALMLYSYIIYYISGTGLAPEDGVDAVSSRMPNDIPEGM